MRSFAAFVLAMLAAVAAGPTTAQALPNGFSDTVAFSGLNAPSAVAFAPDGHVFVAEKGGVVKVFDGLGDTTPTVFADLRTATSSIGDRGLLGLAVDPDFPQRPYVYVAYAYDAEIGGTAPTWGQPDQYVDTCPTPPGPNADGCVVSGRLSRLTANTTTMTMSNQKVLVNDWCQQMWSHSMGDVVFDSAGRLYVAAGDGATYSFADYGQKGDPLNPCGDPPAGVGGVQTPPTAEGGALRAQDYRTSGDPLGLDGSVIRVDPDTGRPIPDMPGETNQATLNLGRMVAYGFRNPFRIAVRPSTNEVWAGDVGWSSWEEIDRIIPGQPPQNFGWPCEEGADLRPQGYFSLGLNICNGLYADASGKDPYYSYEHGEPVAAGEDCALDNGSAISGLAFYDGDGSASFPGSYDDGLFFADYSRFCIWFMRAGENGLPDPDQVEFFERNAGAADLEVGPDGALYWASIATGEIRRIAFEGDPGNQPPAVTIDAPAEPATFSAGQRIAFSGSATDPEDGALPGASLSWRLVASDCSQEPCVERPLDLAPDGRSGQLTAPQDPLAGGLRLELKAVDSGGKSTTASREIDPSRIRVVVDSNRKGAKVSAAGNKGGIPLRVDVLKGSAVLLSTPRRQPDPGKRKGAKLRWRSWLDGGARVHYVTPKRDRTYKVRYKLIRPRR